MLLTRDFNSIYMARILRGPLEHVQPGSRIEGDETVPASSNFAASPV